MPSSGNSAALSTFLWAFKKQKHMGMACLLVQLGQNRVPTSRRRLRLGGQYPWSCGRMLKIFQCLSQVSAKWNHFSPIFTLRTSERHDILLFARNGWCTGSRYFFLLPIIQTSTRHVVKNIKNIKTITMFISNLSELYLVANGWSFLFSLHLRSPILCTPTAENVECTQWITAKR